MEAQHTPAFSDYVAALKRRRTLLLGLGLPILVVALLLAVALPDVYTSSGLIEIQDESQRSEYLGSAPRTRDEPNYADEYVSSLKGIVLSEDNLRQLMKKYELYPDRHMSEAATLRRLRKDINVDIVTVPILDPRTGREREVVTAFRAGYDSRSPEHAQQVANWLVESFLAANRRQYQQRAASAAQFFGNEAERLGTHIAGLEAKLADFKNKNYGRLPELTEVNMTVMDRTERDLENLQLQSRSLRQERVFLTAQLQQALDAHPEEAGLQQLETEYQRMRAQYDESHPDVVSLRRQIDNLRRGGPAIGASLQSQLETQRSVLAEARQRYSADHPDVRRIQRNIDALQARIGAGERSDAASDVRTPVAMQLKTQLAAIDTQLAAIAARSSEVRRKLEQVEGDIVSSPQVEREYQTLTRDLSIARTKYEELLKRQMDSQISEAAIAGGRADEFRLVQPPLLPAQPSKPARAAIALVGLIIALIAALTVTLAVEALDPTVRGARDIRDVLGVTTLAAVPSIRNSVSRRRQVKRAFAMAASLLIGISVVYYVIQQAV